MMDQDNQFRDSETLADVDQNALLLNDELRMTKISVKYCTMEGLKSIPCLSDEQREEILHHMEKYGTVLCPEELQTIPSMDKNSILCMKEYMRFPEAFSMPDELNPYFTQDIKLEVTGLMKKSKVSPESPATSIQPLGDSWKSSMRIRAANLAGVKLGLNAEKDAGEYWWTKNGPDHVGWFLQYDKRNKPISVLIGDFDLDFGQGLVFGKNSFAGTGGEVALLQRNPIATRPHSSMNEDNYMKGISASFRKKHFTATVFVSKKPNDGRIIIDENSGGIYVSGGNSGYHRTLAELQTRHSTTERQAGGHLQLTFRKLKIGITAASCTSNLPAQPSTETYRKYTHQEQQSEVAAMDYSWKGSRHVIFGESCQRIDGSWSTTNGLLLHPDQRLGIGIQIRHSSRSYEWSYSNPSGFSTNGNGETGIYAGINFRLNDRCSFNLFHDEYVNSWLTYQCNTLQRGKTDGARLTLTKGKNTELVVQVKFKSELHNTTGNRRIEGVSNEVTRQKRVQITIKPAFGWQLRYRLEQKTDWFAKEQSTGTMAFQDIRYQPDRFPISIVFRMCVFKTPGYSTALYMQESEPAYSYKSTATYGSGTGCYILLHATISKSLDGWIKFGKTYLNDRFMTDELAGVAGRQRQEFTFQLRWKRG